MSFGPSTFIVLFRLLCRWFIPVTFHLLMVVDRQIFHSPLGDIQSGDLESSINLSNATGYLYSNVVGTPNLFNLSNFIFISEGEGKKKNTYLFSE